LPELKDILVFRMIALDNLESDLTNGLYSKLNAPNNPDRIDIGNTEIITERDKRIVGCYPETVVNNYVPFYFSVRTPMLFNIYTGHGVKRLSQTNIVYLCIPLLDLANPNYQWCFTDGNAAKVITRYFNNLNDIDKIDWRSIVSSDFKHDNADGDEDRIRKKHSEFLVRDHVPNNKIMGIAVYNTNTKETVDEIVQRLGLNISVKVKRNFYF
jgi:ssDNA thymidine ADP-ribosyltransferase, DarT